MSRFRKRTMRALCLSSSLIGLASAGAVQAQDTADAEEDTGGVDVIIVTANKVSENVQDVPIAITALTGERLEQAGTTSLEALNRLVPSVTFRKGTTSANSALVMRGVGTISFSIASEPSVSTVVDGIVLSRSGQAFSDLVDAERLEVLRGPQGTLFGKNASAGVISIVSKGGTDELEAEARAEWYEGQEYRVHGSLAGPLSDDWSARLTGFYGSYDGNIRNIFNDEDINGYEHYGARGIVDYRGATTTLRFIADYFRANDDCCADVTITSRGAILDAELGLPDGVAIGEEQRYVNHNLTTLTKDTQWSLTASGDFEVSDTHTVSVVTGYRRWFNQEIREGDFFPRPTVQAGQLHDDGIVRTEQFSVEARIASDQTKPFFYQFGGFFWHSFNRQDFTRRGVTCATSTLPVDPITGATPCNLSDTVNTLFPTATSDSDVSVYNYALFGQATYRFSDQFAITGGLRYTWDDLSFTHTRAPGVNATTGLPATGPGISGSPAGGTIASGGNGTNTSAGSITSNQLSGKAVLQYTPTDDLLFYGSYTRGYKGPAFNVFFNHTAPNNAAPISPETSDAFEIGIKSQFFDNNVQLNLAAFTVDYYNFQANNFLNLNGAIITTLTNAGSVRTEGFEADLVTTPFDGLTLRGSAAYADAHVVRFNPDPRTNAPNAANGTQLPFAPKFTFNVGMDYETGLGASLGDAMLYFVTDYRHVSDQFSDVGEQGPIDAYGQWNASLGFSDRDDRYRLTFHLRNITDESYLSINVGNGQRTQIPRDADRYFGISLRVRN